MDPLNYLAIGLGIGLLLLVGYELLAIRKARANSERLRLLLQQTQEESAGLRKEIELLGKSLAQSENERGVLRENLLEAKTRNARQETEIEEWQRRLKQQAKEQEESARLMQERFENLANRIFDQKTAKFSELNQEKLKVTLQPLDKDIREFRKKVEELHEKETNQHVALREFVNGLQKAQSQLSEDARNLTRALKGDAKKQGDWGEFILERALEASGLAKGREFSMQASFDGKRPDAVIHLPGKRQLIIDAKVSLTAYERSVGAESEEERKLAIKEHLVSIRRHVDELSQKDYSGIEELTCPDFTLLFIPVEPAFGAALAEDPELYQYAFDRKIALITASTLMATIKTVANLWKLEKQNRHAQDVAKRAGLLLDKFAGFLGNVEEIGKSLQRATDAHVRAIGQLSTGPGNLISQAEKLKSLGVSAKKALPESFRQKSIETEEEEELSFPAEGNDEDELQSA